MTLIVNYLVLCLASMLYLVVASPYEDQKSPFGTMRFGKRFIGNLYDDYNDLEKRSSDEETQRNIRTPLGTMRFGKRGGGPLGTMRFGKRSINDEYPYLQLQSQLLQKRQPLGTMRFGK